MSFTKQGTGNFAMNMWTYFLSITLISFYFISWVLELIVNFDMRGTIEGNYAGYLMALAAVVNYFLVAALTVNSFWFALGLALTLHNLGGEFTQILAYLNDDVISIKKVISIM